MKVLAAVRQFCLVFPGAEEVESRGDPNFKIDGKTFAIYVLNHHGDGRVSLWLEAPKGNQAMFTETEPDHYFIPPYVGPKGWLGVNLNTGLPWESVAERIREACLHTAKRNHKELEQTTIAIPEKVTPLTAEEIDPLKAPRVQKILDKLGALCEALPETSKGLQFGNPVWKAGKKTFVVAFRYSGKLRLQFWVGAEAQAFLTADPRYKLSQYTGHNGWIDLDVENAINWAEVEDLLKQSYRHFALQRMLKQLHPA